MDTHLDEQRPESVILLAGGNDLWECARRINPTPVREIADHIIEAGKTCKRYNVENIYISSVLPRSSFYLQLKRKELNTILRDLCEENDFIFIDNKNIILSEHISNDGVHLNNVGSDLLANNFLHHLNSGM